jgi:hypothetical protein
MRESRPAEYFLFIHPADVYFRRQTPSSPSAAKFVRGSGVALHMLMSILAEWH